MTSCRRRLCAAVLVALLVTLLAGSLPAHADDTDDPALAVTITGLSPSALVPGQPVTMSGTVTNGNDFTWTDLQAYLVMPRAPFTTRAQITAAISGDQGYTGQRIVELESIDDLGPLPPGESTTFTVTVPWEQLRLTEAEGVYPVGVQLLGTRPDGERLNRAVGRATTFLPLVHADRSAVPGTLVWPFFMPLRRGADGSWQDRDELVEAVGPDGRLRNLLDLAASTPVGATTVLLDPALLDGLGEIAADDTLEARDVERVQAFTDDLVELARRGSTWTTGYGRPDQLALTRGGERGADLRKVVDRAGDAVLDEAGVTGRRSTWVGDTGIEQAVAEELRRFGDQPLVVSSSQVPQWSSRDGSVVTFGTSGGPVPLLVTDDLSAGLPGGETPVTLRQRVLTEAALGSLQRGLDPASDYDAVTVVSPTWDPGAGWRSGGLDALWQTPWVTATTLDALLLSPRPSAGDRFERPTTAPLGGDVLAAVDELRATGSLVDSLDDADGRGPLARRIAGLLSITHRDDPQRVIAAARAQTRALLTELDGVTIEGPPSFILSGSKGTVPLTIGNTTGRTLTVGIRISSTNPALDVPDVEPISIAPGQRHTVDVVVDVGRQNSSTLTAQLISPEGSELGDPATFNVRSSNVGAVIWIAMGVAGTLVVLALARRLVVRRRGRPAEDLP